MFRSGPTDKPSDDAFALEFGARHCDVLDVQRGMGILLRRELHAESRGLPDAEAGLPNPDLEAALPVGL